MINNLEQNSQIDTGRVLVQLPSAIDLKEKFQLNNVLVCILAILWNISPFKIQSLYGVL